MSIFICHSSVIVVLGAVNSRWVGEFGACAHLAPDGQLKLTVHMCVDSFHAPCVMWDCGASCRRFVSRSASVSLVCDFQQTHREFKQLKHERAVCAACAETCWSSQDGHINQHEPDITLKHKNLIGKHLKTH